MSEAVGHVGRAISPGESGGGGKQAQAAREGDICTTEEAAPAGRRAWEGVSGWGAHNEGDGCAGGLEGTLLTAARSRPKPSFFLGSAMRATGLRPRHKAAGNLPGDFRRPDLRNSDFSRQKEVAISQVPRGARATTSAARPFQGQGRRKVLH